MSNTYEATNVQSSDARILSLMHAIGSAVSSFLAGIAVAREFGLEIERLSAKSDIELRELGLSRSDIPRFVSSRLGAN